MGSFTRPTGLCQTCPGSSAPKGNWSIRLIGRIHERLVRRSISSFLSSQDIGSIVPVWIRRHEIARWMTSCRGCWMFRGRVPQENLLRLSRPDQGLAQVTRCARGSPLTDIRSINRLGRASFTSGSILPPTNAFNRRVETRCL